MRKTIFKIWKSNKVRFASVTLAVILICVVISIIAIRDIRYTQYMERVHSTNVVMSKIGNHMNFTFNEKWDNLDRIKKRINNNFDIIEDFSVLQKTLIDISKEEGINCGFVDSHGFYHDKNGITSTMLSFGTYEPDKTGFLLLEPRHDYRDTKRIVYYSAFDEPLEIDGYTIQYIALQEEMIALQESFDISNYGDNCLSFIILENGSIVYNSNVDDAISRSYNLLEFIKTHFSFNYKESYEQLSYNIKNNINSTVLVTYNGERYYLSYFQLEMSNWLCVMLVPEFNLESGTNGFTQRVVMDISSIFITAIVLFTLCLFYMWRRSINEQRELTLAEKAANDAKTNFLSSMSHDIRTPLNAIINLTEIAEHHVDDPVSTKSNLERISLSSKHLLTLINNILDISKIESGKLQLNISEFSLVESIQSLVNILRPQAREKGIDFRVHVHNFEEECICGDELRISQVCINLLTNAVKYSDYGGKVDFDIYQENVENAPDMLRLKFIVRDNGMGMSEEYQAKMYSAFTREIDSRVNKIAGSGLGLTICKQMVDLMDGTVECESALGKGTCFTVTLMLKRASKKPDYKALPKLRIIIIDKDNVSLNTANEVLTRLGLEADFMNEFDAKKLRDKSEYTLSFVDFGFNDNSGIEAAHKLREYFGEDFPIVMTGMLDLSDQTELLAQYNISYTTSKPNFLPVIYNIINTILDAKAQSDYISAHNEQSSVAGMHLLVAEDNDLNWEILKMLLEMQGITADRAENGKKCVEMMEGSTDGFYAAILMDVRMPIMDGREATRVLRHMGNDYVRGIPIIALTADAFAEDIQECLNAGMDSHLAKPVDMKLLLSLLRKVKNGEKISKI